MRWLGVAALALAGACAATPPPPAPEDWIPAADASLVRREGAWAAARHRYAAADALVTREDGAALEVTFRGGGLAVAFDSLTVPSYGRPEGGAIEVAIDGRPAGAVRPLDAANEVALARGLSDGNHRARLVHRSVDGVLGCRILGFRVLPLESADLSFVVTGDALGELVDVRAVVRRDGRVVRNALARNWRTGECRLTALPSGARLDVEIVASGWTAARRDGIVLEPGREARLAPISLAREEDVPPQQVRFPSLGHPVVRRPGETFRARLEAYEARIEKLRVVRRCGPALVSRICPFRDDPAAGYYYYKEGTVTLPDDVPPGLYDLEVELTAGRGSFRRISRRSVHVVSEYPRDPVFLSVGHLDTWGQTQAEYLARVVEMANLLGVDMVLVSNEVNAAYVAGALYRLDVPFVVNFGNHQVYGHERWFGEPVGAVDLGPGLSVLNFGPAWDSDFSALEKLLAARAAVPCKVLNAFEPNAPVADLLDRYRIRLIHDGHGPEPKVERLGATPTLRVGKVNSESFRLLRFKGAEPVSATYRGQPDAAIPFRRDETAPVRARVEPADDGTHARLTAVVVNDLDEPVPGARLTFVLPSGDYRVRGARPEASLKSDDGRFTLLTVRLDLPARREATVTVEP